MVWEPHQTINVQRSTLASRLKIGLMSAGALLLGVIVVLTLTRLWTHTSPLPKAMVNSVAYRLYYPSSLPGQYKYAEGSVEQINSVTTYKITSSDKTVVVSQQALPKELESFRLDGFEQIATTVGQMLVGETKGMPTAIVTTQDTLITITGSGGANKQDVTQIGQNLSSVD